MPQDIACDRAAERNAEGQAQIRLVDYEAAAGGSIIAAVNNEGQKYWFPAKRYGWGWGLPLTWQGWLVLIVWLVVLISATIYFRIPHRPVGFLIFLLVMSVLLVAICYKTGEPPRWRWGDRDD